MQVCTSLQTETTPAPHHSVFTGRMPFLPPNQQRQSTEGTTHKYTHLDKIADLIACNLNLDINIASHKSRLCQLPSLQLNLHGLWFQAL